MVWTRRGLVHIVFAVVVGCGTITEQPPPEPVSQEQVGAVHLAVVSLAPWSEYVESMQPHFQLTAGVAPR